MALNVRRVSVSTFKIEAISKSKFLIRVGKV